MRLVGKKNTSDICQKMENKKNSINDSRLMEGCLAFYPSHQVDVKCAPRHSQLVPGLAAGIPVAHQ